MSSLREREARRWTRAVFTWLIGIGGLLLFALSAAFLQCLPTQHLDTWLQIVAPLHGAIAMTQLYEVAVALVHKARLSSVLARVAWFGFNAAFALAELLLLLPLQQI